MPVHGVSGSKPMRPQDALGLDVKLESKDLENDEWVQSLLRETGRAQAETGMEYLGSIAVHYYKSDSVDQLSGRYAAFTKSQIAIGTLNEALTNMGISNLVIELKKRFNRSTKTMDSLDRRG